MFALIAHAHLMAVLHMMLSIPLFPSIEPYLTIIINLVHRVESVCTNRTCSHDDPFVCGVVYVTLPSIQPSLAYFMGSCGLDEVCVDYRCHSTLY